MIPPVFLIELLKPGVFESDFAFELREVFSPLLWGLKAPEYIES